MTPAKQKKFIIDSDAPCNTTVAGLNDIINGGGNVSGDSCGGSGRDNINVHMDGNANEVSSDTHIELDETYDKLMR